MNIENYSLRDKILFNTTLPIKRSTPEEQVHQLMEDLKQRLAGHKSVETGAAMARVTGLTSSAVNVEIFCYVLTADWDRFYEIQGELFLLISDVLKSTGVELA